MKKALVILLAICMVASVFADEPVADVNVAEFSGNASVTWGIDLDTNKTGFKNDAEVLLKLNLLKGGDKTTTGEGVWGELKIKTDSDTFIGWKGNDKIAPNEGMKQTLELKVIVDEAKLHFGDYAYMGIKSGDTQIGEFKTVTAIRSGDNGNAVMNSAVGPAGYTQGITAGFAMPDLFSIDVDFRNKGQYTDDYAFAADAELKAVADLSLKGGFAMNFIDTKTTGAYGSADYKIGINDTFYVKPQVGFTYDKVGDADAEGSLVGALLFGWGETKDDNAGVYFLNGDSAKKVTPGVSIAYKQNVLKAENDNSVSYISASVYSGEIVSNLTTAGYFGKYLAKDSDGKSFDTGYSLVAAAKYKISVGEGYITPQAGIFMITKDIYNIKENTTNGVPNGEYNFASVPCEGISATDFGLADLLEFDANGFMNVKVGVEVGGYVPNTTFSLEYASRNLNDKREDAATKGTVNFKTKIAL